MKLKKEFKKNEGVNLLLDNKMEVDMDIICYFFCIKETI